MASIEPYRPGLLFVGMLAGTSSRFQVAEESLLREFGPVAWRSQDFAFPASEYYGKDMGRNLSRRFLAFRNAFFPDKLASVKIWTNSLESQTLSEGKRTVNLDPGLLTEYAVILASAKNNAHRIPIGRGIYGETTMLFSAKEKKYLPLSWTYPDFASGLYDGFFLEAREFLRRDL